MAKLDPTVEIWKPLKKIVKNNGKEIIFSNKRYFVSNFGNLKNSKRYLSNKKRKDGYIHNILIDVNNVEVNISRHHLVLQTFNGTNRDVRMVINHIDGNKMNNRIENLEWCSSKYNTIHAYKNNLINKKTSKILQFSINGDFIKKWNSITEACLEYGLSSSNVCRVLNGKSHTAGKYVWRNDGDKFEKYNIKITHILNVAQIDNKTKEVIKVYKNSLQASKITGISNCNISRCLKDQRKTAGGFIWENTEKEEEIYG